VVAEEAAHQAQGDQQRHQPGEIERQRQRGDGKGEEGFEADHVGPDLGDVETQHGILL